MTDRELILGALEKTAIPGHEAPVKPTRVDLGQGNPSGLWTTFEKAFAPLGGKVVAPDALKDLLKGSCYVDADARPLLPCVPSRYATNVWEAEVGVTTADLAVAETGSLLLSAGPGRSRLASLAPPLHVVLIPKQSIVATLEEAILRLPGRTSVLITGTSRTADIEGVLVRGVHGPRDVWVVPV